MIKEFGCSLARYFHWLQAVSLYFISSEGLTWDGGGGEIHFKAQSCEYWQVLLPRHLGLLTRLPLDTVVESLPGCEHSSREQEKVHAKMEATVF